MKQEQEKTFFFYRNEKTDKKVWVSYKLLEGFYIPYFDHSVQLTPLF